MINESFGEPVEGDGTRAINWLRQAVHAISMEIMQNYPFHRVALEATQFQLIGRRSVAQERAQERMSMLQNQWEAKLGRFIQSAMAEGDLYAPSFQIGRASGRESVC